jgi:hypothetical protein
MEFHQVLAAALVAVFMVLSVLHLYWAAGGRWALDGALPRAERGHEGMFVAGPLMSLAVAMALLSAAAVCATRVGFIDPGTPPWMAPTGVWVLAAVFALRAVGDFRYVGFFKRIRGTIFARRDDLIYSPLCAALSVTSLALALLAP